MAAKTNKTANKSIVVAKQADGTVQITFTVPYPEIKKGKEKVLIEFQKEVEIPGFRKGNAPISKVKEKIPENTLLEHTLSHILPTYLTKAITENKLKIAIYPKFQVIKSKENEDWEIRALTAEFPKIEIGEYKKIIKGELASKAIWTPGKGEEKTKKPSKEEKEQVVIKTLLKNIKINVPKIIIDDEVDTRLANLLQRIEKLGLSLERYLVSIGKTAETLRAEHEKQASEAISLDLILNEIAEKEGIKAEEKEIAPTIIEIKKLNPKITEAELERQTRTLSAMIRKRKTLDSLISLA